MFFDKILGLVMIIQLTSNWWVKYIIAFVLSITSVYASDNVVTVDQVGSYNTTQITQDGTDNRVSIKTGHDSDVDNTYIAITQQGLGAKTAYVDIRSGTNNGITMFQDGAGNHTAAIQNLSGSANNITVSQTGAGSHSLTVTGQTGTTNSGNTIDATQSGSGNKSFDLTLGGTSGANVTIQQTNPTQSNSGSMTIQCMTCGSYSYIRQ